MQCTVDVHKFPALFRLHCLFLQAAHRAAVSDQTSCCTCEHCLPSKAGQWMPACWGTSWWLCLHGMSCLIPHAGTSLVVDGEAIPYKRVYLEVHPSLCSVIVA